ncbi:hypothetical protein FRC07_014040, partial [Ceratobasidium sp. 392]
LEPHECCKSTYHSNPIPTTPPEFVKPEDVDMDKGGDTEREVDNRSLPPISHAPARPSTTPPTGGSVRHTHSAVTPGTKPAPLGRSIPRGSIVDTTVHSVLSRRCPGGTGRDGMGYRGDAPGMMVEG